MASNQITAIQAINTELDVTNTRLQATLKTILEISKQSRDVSSNFSNVKVPQDVSARIKATATNTEQLNAQLKEQDRLERTLISQLAKKELATDSTNRAVIKNRVETQQQNRAIKEAATLSSKLSSELQKATIIRNRLAKVIADLNIKRNLGNRLSVKEQALLKRSTTSFNRYDNAIRKANASVGRFQANVGNYPRAFGSAAGAARNLAGALGLVGGAFLIVAVIRDVTRRIIQFDKSMQNLAGVLRTSRAELIGLEKEIISVAGSSIKTATEVATLAETLVTLGKTQSEVERLLKPVVDLGIGLNATSEEAGEFLVQMLNTFGASIDEADNFADTIATIRTSTSLDFQKIRDSFQFLAPISRALGKDLADTGALIGILADNGIRAERAGRLLGTAQQKLASENKSLNDALDELSTAQKTGISELELLALSSSLFGKQAAALGLVLANNTDLIDKNAQAIRDNSGALDDLVGQQLQSLSANLKLLDSAWESLILNVENGTGAISTFFKSGVQGATNFLNVLSDINTVSDIIGEDTSERSLTDGVFTRLFSGVTRARDATKEFQSIQSEFLTIDLFNINEIQAGIDIWSQMRTEVEGNTDVIKILDFFVNKLTSSQTAYYEAARDADDTSRTNEQIEAVQSQLKLIPELTRQLGVLQKQRAAILNDGLYASEEESLINTNKSIAAIKSRIKAVQGESIARIGSIKAISDHIAELKTQRDTFGTTNREIETYNNLIDKSERQLTRLKEGVISLSESIKSLSTDDAVSNIADIFNFEGLHEILAENSKLLENDLDKQAEIFKEQQDRITDIQKTALELRAKLESDFSESAVELVNSVFEARVQGYENDIEENTAYYDAILDNENLTEEQRSSIEAERDRKENELRAKQREEEKKAFVFKQALALANVGIALAQTLAEIQLAAAAIDAITFGIGGSIYRAANIPLAIATSAIQAGAIVAATIPAFAEGKGDYDNYEGNAIWGEKRREVKISKNGNIEVSPRNIANHLTHVKSDDVIHPNANEYFAGLSDSDLMNDLDKHSIIASMEHQNSIADSYIAANMISNSYQQQTNRIVNAIKQNKTKFNVTNKVSLGQDIKYLNRKNSVL